jgi:hypothetical protein
MIDAYQATVVAYQTHDGDIIAEHELPDEIRERGEGLHWRDFDELMEQLGFTALSRYSIHEWESQNWGELPYSMDDFVEPSEWIDYGEGKNVDYQNETVLIDGEWVDVSAYIGVFSSLSGERIE